MKQYRERRRSFFLSCRTGKIVYPTPDHAEVARVYMEDKGVDTRIYQCSFCHLWHLTTQEKIVPCPK
jgi:hypothetical protein